MSAHIIKKKCRKQRVQYGQERKKNNSLNNKQVKRHSYTQRAKHKKNV